MWEPLAPRSDEHPYKRVLHAAASTARKEAGTHPVLSHSLLGSRLAADPGGRTSFELSEVAAHFCSSERISAGSLPPMLTAASRTCCTASTPAARNARMMACRAQPCSHGLRFLWHAVGLGYARVVAGSAQQGVCPACPVS